MNFSTIDEVYAANDAMRAKLLEQLDGITAEQEELLTEKGDWTLSKIVEHVAMVERSMLMIITKLLGKAKEAGLPSDGTVKLSPGFVEGATRAGEEGLKFDAPEVVQPKGGQPVADSIAMMKESRAHLKQIRGLFDESDGTAFAFPHPAFGDMTAIDWLVLVGGHESRHTKQIAQILARKDAAKA
jgi:uncharacterized damage-inducible protein DinB